MNKILFRVLVFLMSISLIGIILVQVYWFKSSLDNNQEQFKFHVTQVIGNVADKLEQQEAITFYERINKYIDSTGSEKVNTEFLEFGYFERDSRTNETIIYTSSTVAEDFIVSPSFFDRKFDSLRVKNFNATRKTEVYSGPQTDRYLGQDNLMPDMRIEKSGKLSAFDKARYEINFKDIAATYPIQRRIDKDKLKDLLHKDLETYGVITPFEFGIYSNGLATKVKSEDFRFDKENTYGIPVFTDNEGNSRYQLLVSFPDKKKFLFSNLIGITLLSMVFTLIIVIAYSSALNQLIKQKKISEIKTDFINNMTHEFKTPIATINLALDAIKNPKIIENKETVQRYLQMIRDENKRMHAQVENVLRISKLDKKELDISKEPLDINDVLSDAIDHVSLILESRNGEIKSSFNASRTTVLVNDMHFTNVLVNILDNAIKYSENDPKIEISTENVNDFLILCIADNGIGMSKAVVKRIFEKFYREHTGDLHNVKGHGLGLSYVKRIIDEHNCQIFVESEKGKGSIFTIKIPLIN
jgi:two-component system, OmpR family, phosphate regulon sensor histidine kinase PhoR